MRLQASSELSTLGVAVKIKVHSWIGVKEFHHCMSFLAGVVAVVARDFVTPSLDVSYRSYGNGCQGNCAYRHRNVFSRSDDNGCQGVDA